jgi:membrane protein DedA with SNARE-associated domain
MAAENLFPPIPSEAVMPLAGYLTTTGRFNLYWTIGAGVLGSLIGAVALYYIGVWLGDRRLRKFLGRFGKFFMTGEKELDAAEGWFNRHGEKSVFLARMVPIVRSIISIPAGFVRMRIRRFMFWTSLGTFIWTAAETVAGVLLGKNWKRIGAWMEKLDLLVVAIILGLLSWYAFRRFKPRQNWLGGKFVRRGQK